MSSLQRVNPEQPQAVEGFTCCDGHERSAVSSLQRVNPEEAEADEGLTRIENHYRVSAKVEF